MSLNNEDHFLTPSQKEEQIATFLFNFRNLLNHYTQWLFGAGFILIGVISWRLVNFLDKKKGTFIIVPPYSNLVENFKPILANIILYAAFVAEVLLGLILGLIAWRMVVIAIHVKRLCRDFQLQPQLWHPDRAGGLKPLGNLCLFNAAILSIPSFYLGAWIIIAPNLFPIRYGNRYTTLYFMLLLVIITLAVITLFIPLWGVHRLMIAKQAEIKPKIEHLGQDIDRLVGQMLEKVEIINPADGDKVTEKLAFLRQVYQDYQRLLVWPFELRIFFLLQALPVIGWPAEKLVENLPAILEFIPKYLKMVNQFLTH